MFVFPVNVCENPVTTISTPSFLLIVKESPLRVDPVTNVSVELVPEEPTTTLPLVSTPKLLTEIPLPKLPTFKFSTYVVPVSYTHLTLPTN